MTRTRLNPSAPALKTLDEVDQTLERLGAVTRELEKINHDCEAAIAQARDVAKAMSQAPAREKAALEAALKDYGGAHRGDFVKERSRELMHGSIGFRLSHKIVIKRIGDTLAALRAAGLTHCIRITEAPDKDAMRALDGETLASVGAALKTEDAFWYELKREDVEGVK